MAINESPVAVTDTLTVQLVTVTPEPPPPADASVQPTTPDASPTEQAAEATIEQTGAGPPPDEAA